MSRDFCFRFLDARWNRALLARLKKSKIDHHVESDGLVRYRGADEDAVDDVICAVRQNIFQSWQVLTCPQDWVEHYRSYMSQHQIPFVEELSNGVAWFLIERSRRPHTWKLDEPMPSGKLRAAV